VEEGRDLGRERKEQEKEKRREEQSTVHSVVIDDYAGVTGVERAAGVAGEVERVEMQSMLPRKMGVLLILKLFADTEQA
jgi:hypothetical protein